MDINHIKPNNVIHRNNQTIPRLIDRHPRSRTRSKQPQNRAVIRKKSARMSLSVAASFMAMGTICELVRTVLFIKQPESSFT